LGEGRKELCPMSLEAREDLMNYEMDGRLLEARGGMLWFKEMCLSVKFTGVDWDG
jgi:hypothetical protein